MTLVDRVSSGNKMASVGSATRNSLSFSIQRLLEKSGDDPADGGSPEESHQQVDESDEEDIKVNDSDDDESAKITADYPIHPAPSIGLDWYALYALQQQQQQQQQQHPIQLPSAMFPSHLMNPSAYVNVPHPAGSSASGSAAESYLSYLSRSLSGSTPAGSVATPAGFAAPMGSFAPAQESLSPGSIQPINSGGIPNAFAALLEATVFKDRLAAGYYFNLIQLS